MAEYEPYTKEERERLVASMERWNMLGQDRVIEVFAGAVVIEVRRYEATVAALEAELARLRPLAAVGEAVEGMPVGFGLSHAAEDIWLTWDNRGLDDEVDETCGQTALATLRELAALRAAKGEGHAH